MVKAFIRKHHFLLRRLHSLTGIVPVGGYLILHLAINSLALRSEEAFHAAVRFANALPGLHFLEFFVIYLPILFHGIYGVFIAAEARHNVRSYSHGRNWAFYFQRVTGIITLLYIIWHTYELPLKKWTGQWGPYLGGDSMSGLPTVAIVQQTLSSNLVLAITIIGVVAASYHLCNGIYTFLITWGVTVGERSQRISNWLTNAAFVAMSAWGVTIAFAFR